MCLFLHTFWHWILLWRSLSAWLFPIVGDLHFLPNCFKNCFLKFLMLCFCIVSFTFSFSRTQHVLFRYSSTWLHIISCKTLSSCLISLYLSFFTCEIYIIISTAWNHWDNWIYVKCVEQCLTHNKPYYKGCYFF